jgi:hypothetical protein
MGQCQCGGTQERKPAAVRPQSAPVVEAAAAGGGGRTLSGAPPRATTAQPVLGLVRGSGPTPTRVVLHVYDLEPKNKGSMTRSLGFGAYHSGLEVLGVEYSFGGSKRSQDGSGIFGLPPKTAMPAAQYHEAVVLGTLPGEVTLSHIRVVLASMMADWKTSSYNLVGHNCNHFSEAFRSALNAQVLKPRGAPQLEEIPSYVNRAARWGKSLMPSSQAGKLGGGAGGAGQPTADRGQLNLGGTATASASASAPAARAEPAPAFSGTGKRLGGGPRAIAPHSLTYNDLMRWPPQEVRELALSLGLQPHDAMKKPDMAMMVLTHFRTTGAATQA